MQEREIAEKLEASFRKVFNMNTLEIKREMTANDIDKWDSLTHMLLISEIEDTFEIRFKLKELNRMKNVGDMIDLISEKMQ
ncbi:MAG TPA: acyl carrier protein [Bacteroidales bacterium]|jgi:acyl carrier protein|nr:acyl carrier protein [Bacteroidales bacterium]HPS88058.1 acyl carrier protein [Spirochaetota bacterium]